MVNVNLLHQSMRGPTSTHLFLNLSPGLLRTASWVSSNKNSIHIALSQPRHYYATSSGGDSKRKAPGPWIHHIALELSSWMSLKQPRPKQHLQRLEPGANRNLRWAHYIALGLWRNASQEEIKVSLQAVRESFSLIIAQAKYYEVCPSCFAHRSRHNVEVARVVAQQETSS